MASASGRQSGNTPEPSKSGSRKLKEVLLGKNETVDVLIGALNATVNTWTPRQRSGCSNNTSKVAAMGARQDSGWTPVLVYVRKKRRSGNPGRKLQSGHHSPAKSIDLEPYLREHYKRSSSGNHMFVPHSVEKRCDSAHHISAACSPNKLRPASSREEHWSKIRQQALCSISFSERSSKMVQTISTGSDYILDDVDQNGLRDILRDSVPKGLSVLPGVSGNQERESAETTNANVTDSNTTDADAEVSISAPHAVGSKGKRPQEAPPGSGSECSGAASSDPATTGAPSLRHRRQQPPADSRRSLNFVRHPCDVITICNHRTLLVLLGSTRPPWEIQVHSQGHVQCLEYKIKLGTGNRRFLEDRCCLPYPNLYPTKEDRLRNFVEMVNRLEESNILAIGWTRKDMKGREVKIEWLDPTNVPASVDDQLSIVINVPSSVQEHWSDQDAEPVPNDGGLTCAKPSAAAPTSDGRSLNSELRRDKSEFRRDREGAFPSPVKKSHLPRVPFQGTPVPTGVIAGASSKPPSIASGSEVENKQPPGATGGTRNSTATSSQVKNKQLPSGPGGTRNSTATSSQVKNKQPPSAPGGTRNSTATSSQVKNKQLPSASGGTKKSSATSFVSDLFRSNESGNRRTAPTPWTSGLVVGPSRARPVNKPAGNKPYVVHYPDK